MAVMAVIMLIITNPWSRNPQSSPQSSSAITQVEVEANSNLNQFELEEEEAATASQPVSQRPAKRSRRASTKGEEEWVVAVDQER